MNRVILAGRITNLEKTGIQEIMTKLFEYNMSMLTLGKKEYIKRHLIH